MVHYVQILARQHGVSSSKISDHIERLEEAIGLALPPTSTWHGLAYHQGRKRQHPSWLRKELIFACAGHKGLKRLDEIWYQTWVFVMNMKIEGDLNESLIRSVLGLEMTVEKVERTDGGQYDALTKRMLHLRNEIAWSHDAQAGKAGAQGCWYFGRLFEIGRHV
ncbi:hypothetical protein N7513_004746 [Penicillium frequentans]|uniref:Uncharacterized protein n=1 Tax=Penicillium frequentans TaxID=3151616 RepID=A0AAD6GJZ9_9EURO|nr:hypothetical protein N7513_004746 [Penicillium glabrum]KAJ5556711.1 hypothetical protein N7494_000626 [Penicillium glabrum]